MAVLLAWATAAGAAPVPFVCGDADGSGRVSVSDGVQVLRSAAGTAGVCAVRPDACDVDGDGGVSVTDGVAALRLAAGLSVVTGCVSPIAADESATRRDVTLPGCQQPTRESHYCLTIADVDFGSRFVGLAVLGLDSGDLCPLHDLAPEWTTWSEPSSLGWRGEVVYVCTYDGLVRISLRDGTAEATPLPCLAATANDEAVFVMHEAATTPGPVPWVVDAYASYDAVRADDVQRRYQLPFNTRMTVTDDRLFGAWHSTGTVDVVDLASNVQRESLRLEGYDDWIHGIAVTDDGQLVVTRFDGDQSVVTVFDAGSGDRLRTVSVPAWLSGLACIARRAAPME